MSIWVQGRTKSKVQQWKGLVSWSDFLHPILHKNLLQKLNQIFSSFGGGGKLICLHQVDLAHSTALFGCILFVFRKTKS